VDYDNRRRRIKNLATAADKDQPNFTTELATRWPDPDIKIWIMAAGLRLRRRWPDVFSFGEYIPLTVTGAAADHVLAFARRADDCIAITVIPRHFYRLTASGDRSHKNKMGTPALANWEDTSVILPADFPRQWTSSLSGESHSASNSESDASTASLALGVADLFAVFPVALITSQQN
jgi:(1->4)-alpha-D-glucan 1-alpha-D-glucosylmutase